MFDFVSIVDRPFDTQIKTAETQKRLYTRPPQSVFCQTRTRDRQKDFMPILRTGSVHHNSAGVLTARMFVNIYYGW